MEIYTKESYIVVAQRRGVKFSEHWISIVPWEVDKEWGWEVKYFHHNFLYFISFFYENSA